LNSFDAVAALIGENNYQIQAPGDTRPRAEPRVFVRKTNEVGNESRVEGLRVSQVLLDLTSELGTAEPPQHQLLEFLTFLGRLKENREVHVVALKTGISRHPSIREWFSTRRRYHLHYAPVGSRFCFASAWIGMVENWLTEISSKESPNRASRNVRDLLDAIASFVENGDREFPFAWWAAPLGRFQRRRTDGRTPGIVLRLIAELQEMLTRVRAR
jgi:hypothetical protein